MLVSVFLGLSFAAVGVAAHAELAVSLRGPALFEEARRTIVSSTVTNTGDEVATLLNSPGTILSKAPTDAFSILHSSGKRPRFHGLRAKYAPKATKSYTVLNPGQSVTVDHSLADAYDFTTSGPGNYTLTAGAIFYVVSDDCIEQITADTVPYTVNVTSSLVDRQQVASELESQLTPLATFTGCSTASQTVLNAAATAADTLVKDAATYLAANANSTLRYKTWFGNFTAPRHAVVSGVFAALGRTSFSTYSYSCATEAGCEGLANSEGYVLRAQTGRMTLCPDFFDADADGRDSQAGILVHLATMWRAVGDTDNFAVEDDDAEDLALNNPDLAGFNAASYAFFAVNSDPVLP